MMHAEIINSFAKYVYNRVIVRKRSKSMPIMRLTGLLREGQAETSEQLTLCISLGLAKRASLIADNLGLDRLSPSDRIRFHFLQRDLSQAEELAEGLIRECTLKKNILNDRLLEQIAVSLAPINGEIAIGLLQKCRQLPISAIAIAQYLGNSELADKFDKEIRFKRNNDRWLLKANQGKSKSERICCLNRYFNEFGLFPVCLADLNEELSVNNLSIVERTGKDEKNGPLLSIILTAFNAEEHITAAIHSLLSQWYQNFELIIVDDASTDRTWDLIGKIAAEDTRIRPIRLLSNVGSYACKNIALKTIKGEFAAFHDSDDWAHPEKYFRCMVELIRNTDLVAVSSCYARLSSNGRFAAQKIWPLTRWSPNSIVFRSATVLDRIGWLDDMRIGADTEFISRLRIVFGEDRHKKLPLPLTLAAHRQNSLTTATETGFDSTGYSEKRMAYQEAWMEWHLSRLLQSQPIYLQYPHTPRLFFGEK